MSESNVVPSKMLAPAVGAAISLDPLQGLNWNWTPAQNETINAVSPGRPGQELVIFLIASGSTNYSISFGTFFGSVPAVQTGFAQSGSILPLKFISNGINWIPLNAGSEFAQGARLTRQVNFTENATNTIHTGTIPVPAGAWVDSIQVLSSVLWTPTGAATMKVGDTAVDNGYFTGINLKATDLLVGEVLDTSISELWGGKQGAYLNAAAGQRGPVATNFAKYYPAGSNITGIITVGTPATAVGRTHMLVNYSIGETIAAVPSA